MTKRLTLPLSTAATYNPKTDTVVLTSDDPQLGKTRFRVNLRRNTTEDRTLRQLILSEENLDLLVAGTPTGAIPAPAASKTLSGRLPIGTDENGQQILWNSDRNPHLLVVANDYRARAKVFTALFAAAKARDEREWEAYDITSDTSSNTISELYHTRLWSRLKALREEQVSWYTELADPYPKMLLFVDAAETLPEKEVAALRYLLLRGPAAGVQVIAFVADNPTWEDTMRDSFEARLVVGEVARTRARFRSHHAELVETGQKDYRDFPALGENAALFGLTDGTYHAVRFHSAPPKKAVVAKQ